MTVTARLDLAIFDAADIDQVGSFYAELTGWEVVRQDADRFGAPDAGRPGDRVPARTRPRRAAVARTGAPAAVPPRPADRRSEAAAERAVGLGATRLADGASWITLADPAGHPFDLCQADGVGPVMELFAVTIDAPDASALARFYADLTGMEVTYDGPEGALITGDGTERDVPAGRRLQPAPVAGPGAPAAGPPRPAGRRPRRRRGPGAWSWARPGWTGGGERFRVFADPAGHPFCLIH